MQGHTGWLIFAKRCFLCLIHWPFLAQASWTLLESDGPSARSAHAAALDGNQVLWVHAGKGELLLQDLWAYNELLNTWTTVPLFSTAPSARKEHVAMTDGNGDLWIQGGQDDSDYFNDLWKLSSNSWTLVSNGSVPSRSSHVGVWDSLNGALWIHGGYDGVLREDIWKFEVERSGWFSISDENDRPSARAHHVAALDETSGVIWVHGGYDGGLRGDLWKFDTGSYAWDLISVDGPSARAHHVAIWDTMNQALWIHGGFDGMACQDLWRFETLSSTWNSVAQSGPSPRFDHVAVWDPIRLAILIHGGYDQGLHRDLWKFEVPVLTTTTTNTQTTTTSSQTSTTTTSTTSSTILASDISNEGLPSDVLALILALSVIGVLACCCVFQWYRQRQKNREAVVPVPPPLPPPLPPPPPSPKSPQLRVNMQVLVPPPSPQQPPPKPQRTRVAAFSHKDPLYFPDVATLAARRHQSCCESCSSCADIVPVVEQSPLMPEHVCLDILMPPAQPQDVHMAVPSKRTKAELCKPKEPGRTEKAPELPNSTEHAAGHQHRRPLVPGRLQTLADPQPPAPESFGRPKSMNAPVLPESCFRPGRDTEAKARANTAMTTAATPVTSPGHIDVVIELPVQSPQVPRVTSSGSQSPRPKGHPGLRPKSHRPKVPSRTEAAPELPSAGSPGPLGPATLGCPAAPAARFAPIEPLEIAVVLPREAVHHVPQPELDVKRPKCPKRPQLPMATHRPLEVAVEIGPWPPQPPQPPRPAAHQLPWPHFRRRLQRSQSAQTPRRWTKGPKAPKARPRPKSAKPKGRGQPTSTLGGPWWKGYPGYPQIATDLQWKSRDRGDWAVLNENPGPGAYDLEHPRIQGRIPGRVPGYPHVPRDPDKRL